MQVKVGSYVGDGVDNHAITGVGFSPDLVIVRRWDNIGEHIFRTSAMTGDTTGSLGDSVANFAGAIKSLDSDGFTLGTHDHANTDAITYHYLAMRDNGNGDFKVGSYVGDSNDNRDITEVGFQPDFVFTKCGSAASWGVYRFAGNSGDQSCLPSASAPITNGIQSFLSNGFQLGSDTRVNWSGKTYYWFAMKVAASMFAVGSYIGDNTDNRSITGVGFQPDAVLLKSNYSYHPQYRPVTVVGDSSILLQALPANPNRIQALEADGFQIGSNADANYNGSTYWYAAWKTGSPAITEKSASDSLMLSESAEVMEAKTSADSLALTDDSVLNVSHARQDGFALGEFAGDHKTDSDNIVLSEAAALAQAKSASDTFSLGEADAASLATIADAVRLDMQVERALTDQVMLSMEALLDRVTDAVLLQATVSPLITDAQLLEAIIINQELETAGEASVIAPTSEITFI